MQAAQGRALWQEAADDIAAAVRVQDIPVQDMLLLLQRHCQAVDSASGLQPCSQGPEACLAQLVVSSYMDGCTPGQPRQTWARDSSRPRDLGSYVSACMQPLAQATAAVLATRAAYEACIEEHHKYSIDSQLASVINDFLAQASLTCNQAALSSTE